MRAELSPAQEADCLARRKVLWERAQAAKESGTNSPALTGRGNEGFAKDVEAKTGKDKRDTNRAIARAKGLSDDAPHAGAFLRDFLGFGWA
jgi:hypothetical protein